MATLASLTTDVLNRVYGTGIVERPAEDTLNGAINSSVTALQVDTEAMWKRGDFAEFPDNNEIVIFAADASGSTTIRRAQRGTTAASQSDGAVMVKNPPFPRVDIQNVINEVIDHELWPKVWTWHQGTVSWSTGTHTYALPAYIEDVARMYQHDLDGATRFHDFPRSWWDVERQQPAGIAANNLALRLSRVRDEAATVYYVGKRKPDAADIANQSDEVARLVVLGALMKLEPYLRQYAKNHNPTRRDRDEDSDTFRTFRGFGAEFLRARDTLNRRLRLEVPQERVFRRIGYRARVW